MASLPLAAFAFGASCGGPPAPPQAPAAQVQPAALPAVVLPDLGAVAAPASLVLSGRIAKPSATLVTLRTWSRLPMPQSDEIAELVTGEAVGPLVDLDEPIDFALDVGNLGKHLRAETAVSVALKDAEHARATLAERFKLVPAENGAFLVRGLGRGSRGERADSDDSDDSADEDRRSCEIAPAYGPSATRLVCGWSPQALTNLAPWLTRSATRASTTADVHVDLHMAPLHPMISAQKRLFGGILGAAFGSRVDLAGVRELVSSLGGDVIDFALDLDSASFDVHLSDPGAAATANLRFAATTSALTRVAASHPERGGAAPDAFLQLPGDTDFAFFSRGIDEPEVARGRELMLQLLGDSLTALGLGKGEQKAIVDPLAAMTTSSALVYASGVDLEAVTKALAAEKALHDGPEGDALAEARRASAEALLGWRLMQVEEPAARYTAALHDLSGATGSPAFVTAYRDKVGKTSNAPALRLAPLPKGVSLPPGTQYYLADLYRFDGPARSAAAGASKATGGPRKPVTLAIFVVPDGGHTWIGVGGDSALVEAKIEAAIGPTAEKLGARPEIALLKAGPVGSGGFCTARALPEVVAQLDAMLGAPREGTWRASEGFDEVARLPHHGTSPMTFSVTALPGEAPAQVAVTWSMPRASIEDLVATILRHGGF